MNLYTLITISLCFIHGNCNFQTNEQFAVLYAEKYNIDKKAEKICVPIENSQERLPDFLENAQRFPVLDLAKKGDCQMKSSAKGKAVIFLFALCRDDIVTQIDTYKPSLVLIVSNRTFLDVVPKHSSQIAFITMREYLFFVQGNKFNISLYYQTDPKVIHYDVSQLIIFFIAVASVVIGSFFAVLYGLEYRSNPEESPLAASMEGGQLPWWSFIVILLFFSSVLLLLYFFYNIIIWFLIVMFLLVAPLSAEMLFLKIMDQFYKFKDRSRRFFTIYVQWPCTGGRSSFSVRTLALYPFFLSLGIVWCIYRKETIGVVLQNILGVAFCINMIGVVSVGKSLRILTFILIALFIYDIFFVFITPLFFKSKNESSNNEGHVVVRRVKREVPSYYVKKSASIMEQVATGNAGSNNERAPMLLSIPSIYLSQYDYDVCYSGYSMLGFGDIVLPGILVGSMHIFDVFWSIRCRPYFLCSMTGYIIGLACAHVAVSVSGVGQPALLYIVPAILLPVMILAACRAEFLVLWEGLVPADSETQNKLEQSVDPNDIVIEALHSCDLDVDCTADSKGEHY